MSNSRVPKATAIDWAGLRERMALATRAVDEQIAPDAAEAKRLLDERGRALATPIASEAASGERLALATFVLAGERYGIETTFVREIVRFAEFTPVPSGGEALIGVTNFHGEVLAVFDLRAFFGLPKKGVTDLSRLVVLGEGRSEFGVLADEVREIAAIPRDAVLPPPASAPSAGRPYIRGVTADACIVLDAASLLRDPKLYVDESETSEP